MVTPSVQSEGSALIMNTTFWHFTSDTFGLQ